MQIYSDATYYAITETMVKALGLPEEDDYATRIRKIRRVVDFLKAQKANLPDYLQLPSGILLVLFNTWSIPRQGRPFDKLSNPLRRLQILAWKQSRFEFRRNLVRFFETMILFAWYSKIPQPENQIPNKGQGVGPK